VPVPASAAQYYGQNPVHFDNIADAVPDIDSAAPTVTGTPVGSSLAPILLLKTDSAVQGATALWAKGRLPSELRDMVASELEEALEEIAADVCQAEIADIRPKW